MVAHASVASSKPKVELNAHADMCVVGDNCLVIHDHNRPVCFYSYDPKDGPRSAKKVDATVGYKIHRVDRSNDKPSYWLGWLIQPSIVPHAVPSE